MSTRPNWLANATQKVNADIAAGHYKAGPKVTTPALRQWMAWCASTGQYVPLRAVPTRHKRGTKIEHITLTPAALYMEARGW